MEPMVNFNTTEKAVHFSKRLVHSELFFFSSQDRRIVNNRTYYFSLFFQLIFPKQISSKPARILDFLASDSICKYQNRQTNLLNCMDLTQVTFKNDIFQILRVNPEFCVKSLRDLQDDI